MTIGSANVQAFAVMPVEETVETVVAAEATEAVVATSHASDVYLAADGTLSGHFGRISAEGGATIGVSGLSVVFLAAGQTVARATTEQDGSFSVSNLPPGIYGVVASGTEGYSAFSVNVLPAQPGRVSKIDCPVITPENFVTVKQLITGVIEKYESSAASEEPAAPVQLSLPGEGEAYGFSAAISHQTVTIGADGTVQGELAMLPPRPVSDLTVHFVKDNVIVSSAKVQPDATFEATSLTPGVYGLVGVGQDGVFAIALELVADAGAVQTTEYRPVALMRAGVVAGSPVGPGAFGGGGGGAQANQAPPAGAAPAGGAPGGGSGGGSGGGAGGGGGSGLLGTLLGAGAGAAIGAAIADDNDKASSPNM
ncbi:MAG: carboxypeptidase regulatory-like domain-containing protein [Planctomyces sp.]|nr:carboxypeptidase regulatory-like domain-containing protein [Planctomyces sp.]